MPDWTRAELREEMLSHGYRYLDKETGRASGFIQQALEQLLEEDEWAFQEREQEFTPGTALDGLGTVLQVWDPNGQELTPSTRDEMRTRAPGLPDTGTGRWYFRSGRETLTVYPTDTDTYTVLHFSTYGWTDAADDTVWTQAAADDNAVPRVPPEYRDLIILKARILAVNDVDDLDLAVGLQDQYDARLTTMREKLKGGNQVDERRRVLIRSADDWA